MKSIYFAVFLAGMVLADSAMASTEETPIGNGSLGARMGAQVKENELTAQMDELATLEKQMREKRTLVAEDVENLKALAKRIFENQADTEKLATEIESKLGSSEKPFAITPSKDREKERQDRIRAEADAVFAQGKPLSEIARDIENLSTQKFIVKKEVG